MTARNRVTVGAPPAGATHRPTLRVVVTRDRPAQQSPAPAVQAVQQAVSAVQAYRDQGLSPSAAYQAAAAAERKSAIENAAPGYNDANALWRRLG